MKKILTVLCIAGFMMAGHQAQAQRVRYYYYPDENVYFNPRTNSYVYYDNRNWSTVNRLPGTVVIRPHERRVVVYSSGRDVWRDNDRHRRLYWRHGRDRDRDRRY
jgi:hypothetical protein